MEDEEAHEHSSQSACSSYSFDSQKSKGVEARRQRQTEIIASNTMAREKSQVQKAMTREEIQRAHVRIKEWRPMAHLGLDEVFPCQCCGRTVSNWLYCCTCCFRKRRQQTEQLSEGSDDEED